MGPPTLALIAGVWLLSCGKDPLSQVVVVYGADDALAAQASCLLIQVFDTTEGRNEELAPVRVELGVDGELPVRLPLSPEGNDASRTYRLEAQLFAGECETSESLGAQTVSSGYVQNELRETHIEFDSACTLARCPDGFRCYEGECVEYCVDPGEPQGSLEDELRPTAPAPCGSACGEDACVGSTVLGCESAGYYAIDRDCGFGCDAEAPLPACVKLKPTNAPPGFEWDSGLAAIDIDDATTETVFDPDTGRVFVVSRESQEEVAEIRPANADPLVYAELAGIGFQKTVEEGVGVGLGPIVTIDIATGFFTIDSLTIGPLGALRAQGSSSLGEISAAFALLVDRRVSVFGEVSVAATTERPGPGGFVGGGSEFGCSDDKAEGCGLGGGGPGARAPCPGGTFVTTLFSGGAGGSYGAFGGFGGDGANAPVCASLPGGNFGTTYGRRRLTVLVGGSGGGA